MRPIGVKLVTFCRNRNLDTAEGKAGVLLSSPPADIHSCLHRYIHVHT